MSINTYVSKYPRIIIDKRSNSPNDSLQKKITIEEFYDLMHHTHKISDLINDGGDISYEEIQSIILGLQQEIKELKAIIQTQQATIEGIKTELVNTASISDWDVETPGNQDINGDTLGSFMGFDVTEI